MATFPTPTPIWLTVELGSGEITVLASERDTAVVEVRPRDAAKPADVQAAERVLVDFLEPGELVIKSAKPKKRLEILSFGSLRGSVDVRVELPEGSDAKISLGVGETRCEGQLRDCRIGSGVGDVTVHAAQSIKVETGKGSVRLASATGGEARLASGVGDLEIAAVANAKLKADTGKGAIRIGSLEAGDVALASGFGEIEIGVAEGTAAKFEAASGFGKLRNTLSDADGPEASDRIAHVKAHTGFGDITIRRAEPAVP